MSEVKKILEGVMVEWKSLGEVAELKRGRVMSKNYLSENSGIYPVYSSQTANNGEIGKINSFDFSGKYLTWTTDGANAGTIFYREGSFSITNVCGIIAIKNLNIISYKFLFYWLNIRAKNYVYSGMGNPKLMTHQIEKIPIPIPCPDNPEKSLKIQQEIVRILDSLSEETNQLTAALQKELQLHQKQYNFYREELFKFEGKEVEWKALGDVAELVRGNGLPKSDFTETGVPAIHYGQIYTYYKTFTTETKSFVSPETAMKLRKVDSGDVVITNTSENLEDVGKAVAYLGNVQAVTGGHATIIKPSKEMIGKYFAYFTQTEAFAVQKKKLAKGIKVIDVSAKDMSKIKIPIPSLEVQARIVSILDKTDILTNSLGESLMKEIALRNKQYVYYRDRLLSFQSLHAEAEAIQ